jgi:dienelactone hydrolase
MSEEAVAFGSTNLLVGVVTDPDTVGKPRNGPAVIFLNAGLLHKVGPYRLYVDLARKLSSMGFTILRFDLSGIGDSLLGDDPRLYDERVLENIREAMDFLSSRKGVCEFVLIGLCAGADNAHRAAVRDKRVKGAVFFDGYGYRTCGYYVHRYVRKMLSVDRWRNFLKRKVLSAVSTADVDTQGTTSRGEIFARKFPPKEQVTKEIQDLVDRGVNLLYVYSGGVKYSYYNHRGQFRRMFRTINFKGRVEFVYFDGAEHTFPSVTDRKNLMATVCRWMNRHYRRSVS